MIWEPILVSDWVRPHRGVLMQVSDARASQYWDESHLFSERLKQGIASDPEHPRPSCCERDGVLWDLVVVYPAEVRWEASLPRAEFIDGPVVDVEDGLEKAVPQSKDLTAEFAEGAECLSY